MENQIISEQTEYKSFFFRRDVIDEFTDKIKSIIKPESPINNIFTNYKLYNADDVLQTTTSRKTAKTRYMEENPSFRKMKVSNLKKTMNYLSKNICEGIGDSYTRISVVKSMSLTKRDEFYDILVVSDNRIENLNMELKDRLAGVVGFIIVELGECKLYPSAYSINLICTNDSAVAGTGSILMGLYLYTILSHPENTNPEEGFDIPKGIANINISESGTKSYKRKFTTQEALSEVQHIAVLELARGYLNQGGLCMYEKFGFKYNPDMFTEDCFEDYENIPMIIDFNSLQGYSELSLGEKKNKILQISCGNDKGFPKENLCSVRGIDQKILGLLMFLNYYEEHNGTIDNVDYTYEYVTDIVNMLKNYKGVSVSELLRYAENPSILRTRNIENIFNQIKQILEENEEIKGGKKKTKKSRKNKNNHKRKTRKNRK